MHPDLKTVIELQQVDLKIAELTSQIDELPSKIQSFETQLQRFINAHEERKQRLSASQKERRELEGDIQPIQAKIAKHKDQLYEVKTNEQYRAMLKEIAGEEANIRKIEDRVLELMLEAEELQKKVQEAGAQLEGERARVAAETKRLEAERVAAVREREELLKRREELSHDLASEVRDLYERVRKGRNGVAVAAVQEGFCSACNVRLRPQVYNEVRTNQAVTSCENCVRILYYLEPPAPAGEGRSTDKGARAAV